jgi:hypothetical protein
MTCTACTAAEANPLSGRYHSGCTGCKARALANGPEIFECFTRKGRTEEYSRALTKVFGEGKEDEGHEAVKAWARKIKQHQKGTA